MTYKGEYYDGHNFNVFAEERTDPEINFWSADHLPQALKNRSWVGRDKHHYWSARWTKIINGPGRYRFSCTTDDGMRVAVDGGYVINAWWAQGPTNYSAERYLSSGPHTVVIEFFQVKGPYRAYFNFERIGAQDENEARQNWELVNRPGPETAGGLQPARLFEADEEGNPIVAGGAYEIFYCQFNPETYSIQKDSKFNFTGKFAQNRNYAFNYETSKVEPGKLAIKELWFDTSEQTDPSGRPFDVRRYTDKLMAFAESATTHYEGSFSSTTGAMGPPPKVAFQWGPVLFLGIIESLTVKFTHFHSDGTPLRAKATLNMKEFRMRKAYPRQNPTSGSDEELHSIWRVTHGERLDTIAARVYGDATYWRLIARHNAIQDPLDLVPGQLLQLPEVQ